MRVALIFVALAFVHTRAESGAAYATDPQKVLRYDFGVAESSFDPAKSLVYLFGHCPLGNFCCAATLRLSRPSGANGAEHAGRMPEISADYRTFTLRVKPGIYVADDAAFRGKKRELVAEDYVYSIKRLFDPALSSPSLGDIENDLAGSTALLKHVRAGNKMDYDALLEGLRTLDRYTIQIKLVEQNPQSMYNMANPVVASAVAREVVVDHHSSDFGAHPVGTGAYKLAFWKRSSKMEFEYNPNFRESYFDGNPAADDPLGDRKSVV